MNTRRRKFWLILLSASNLSAANSVDIVFERMLSDGRESLQLTCPSSKHCSLKESPTGKTRAVPYNTAKDIAQSFLARASKSEAGKSKEAIDGVITRWSVSLEGKKSEGAILKTQLEKPASPALKKALKSVNTLELQLRALLTE